MSLTLHYLIIPRHLTGLEPGQAIYITGDDFAGVTFMGSCGAAFALVPSGALRLTLGDKRNAPTADIEMQARDSILHPEGRVSRVTPHWATLLTIREMSHTERCELEQWRQVSTTR